MKKRTLIASTALLLVAIMCLATASYAWFTAGANATAKGLSMTTTAGSSLLISGEDDVVDGNHVFKKVGTSTRSGANMTLVTTGDAVNFYTIPNTADVDPDNYAATINGTAIAASDLVPATNTNNAAHVDGVYILKNDSSSTKSVKATLSILDGSDAAVSSSFWNCIRVAVFTSADNTTYTLAGTLALTGANPHALGTYAAQTLYKPTLTGVASLDGNATTYVKLVAWFDGQDDYAYTNGLRDVTESGAAKIQVVFSTDN